MTATATLDDIDGPVGHPVGVTGPGQLYYQCELVHGTTKLVGWIEERGARLGALVAIRGEPEPGYWRVTAVHRPGRNIAWLRDKQQKDRRSLNSIRET